MTTSEQQYFNDLTARVLDEYDTTFVSLAEYDIKNPDNLIYEFKDSIFPRVLCAFLEAGEFHADDDLNLFKEFTPPTEEQLETMLEEYGTRIPEYLNLHCNFSSPDWYDHSWNAIQYIRVSPEHITYSYTKYTFIQDTKIIHGKGLLPTSFYDFV